MATASEIDAAAEAMLKEDPLAMRMLNSQERRELATAALKAAEAIRRPVPVCVTCGQPAIGQCTGTSVQRIGG